ncbi:hypothetical protein BTZ20_0310 [Rhodococcus sp. MTM3W5.2]|nr:hypothetical protein BTZ20_0310 [Rhodococcus sp. MTM3W5.2]
MDANLISRLFFGRACRLPLAIWILHLEGGRFYQSEPPRSIAPQTAITQELSRFVELGLLHEERSGSEHRVYYLRTTSPLWGIIEACVDLVSDQVAAPQ